MAKDRGNGTLAPMQLRFVEEYLIDLNATQAATRAGYKQPHVQGPRLLDNVGVKAAISAAQEKRSKRLQVDSDWVLRRLAMEAEADLADLYDENGNLRPVADWPLIWRQGLVAGIDTAEERDGDSVVADIRKVKLSDRIKRIELIGKHVNVQAFRDQIDHKVTGVSLDELNDLEQAVEGNECGVTSSDE